MQVDAASDRNVSNRRFFKLSHRLYCENTAIVHFVARIFSFRVSSFGFQVMAARCRSYSPKLELLSKPQQNKGHNYKTLELRQL
jgi:hypothetical protein